MSSASAFLAACGGGSSVGTTGAAPQGAPNVFVIVIDDLNDWVGYLGNNQVKTPNLDALAARSTAFLRNYCNEPLCNPSRTSAWSGLTPQQTKVYDNFTNVDTTNGAAVLLPQWMQQHGYEIAEYGKVNHTYDDVGEPLPATLPATNQQCSGIGSLANEGLFDWLPMDIDDSSMSDWKYAQMGIDFLNAAHADPFMLCVGLVRTHLAWYIPQKYFDMYPIDQIVLPEVPANDLDDIPPAGQALALAFNAQNCIVDQGLWASAVQAYMASITFVDTQIGRLVAALDASAHANDTMLVLWSDNGFHLGQKFHWHKQALWEQTTRVPLLMRMPGQTTGTRIDSVVSMQDMFPTILDVSGIPAPYTLAGRSLRPLLSDASTPWDFPVLMTNAQMDAQNHFALSSYDYAIRTNQYRYIRYHDGSTELYDDLADPQEFTNLSSAAANAALIAQLDALMPPVG